MASLPITSGWRRFALLFCGTRRDDLSIAAHRLASRDGSGGDLVAGGNQARDGHVFRCQMGARYQLHGRDHEVVERADGG